MANGLVKRFAEASVEPPLILYTDRVCCGCKEGPSRFNSLFSGWANMVVCLDIFHFMQRLGAGVSHPLYGVFTGSLARCILSGMQKILHCYTALKEGSLRWRG